MNPSYNPTATNGVFPFSEPVLTTYMDLDRLITKAGLTPSENKVVNWLMQGYIEADIADHCGIARQAVDTLLARAVARIVRANNDEWREAYAVV